jgi:hypothetical protein
MKRRENILKEVILAGALLTGSISAQNMNWRQDLEKVHELVMNNSGHIFQNYDCQKWVADYSELLKISSTLSQNEIRVELMELISNLQDGHSGVWIREMMIPSDGSKWFPIRMHYFEEGLYVIAADSKYSQILGGKVEQIGSLSESEATAKLFKISNGENEYGDRFKTPLLMIYPPILMGLGMIENEEKLPLTIRLPDGSLNEIEISSQIYTGGVGDFFESFQSPSSDSVRLDKKLAVTWPSTKWEIEPPYVLDFLADKHILYVKLNVLRDPPNYSLNAIYSELWDTVENKNVEKLILDLRNNGGGNLNNAWPFIFKIREFPSLNDKTKLIVLMGRKTFSAATAFISMLEMHTNATFIGEPSGGRPNQTEGTNVFPPPVLENIEVDIMLSRGRWTHTDPLDTREYIVPDVLIPESITDWIEGVDRAFDAALSF